MKYIIIIATFFSIVSCSEHYKVTDTGVIVELRNTEPSKNPLLINMEVLSPTIVKVAMANSDSIIRIPSLIAKERLTPKVHFDVQEKNKIIELTTDSLVVKLQVNNGKISYFDKSGKLLLEHIGSSIIPFIDTTVENQNSIKQNFNWADDEVLYGLGQHQLKDLSIRGKRIELTQQNTKISSPVILSTKGYGIFWDNYSKSVFNDTGATSSISSNIGDKIQFYFIKGHRFDNIVAGLRDLTGTAPMLPKWAFGYIQSRNRYQNKKELLDVVEKYRRLNIPLDGIILDYLHWGDKGFGSMVFDPTDFSDPEGMIDQLHKELNCKLIVSVWPSFKKGIDNWKLFNDKKYLLDLGLGGFGQVYDAFNPEAGKLYFDLVKKSYLDKGVDAIWFDATEPEQFDKFAKTTSFIGPTAKYLNLFSYYDMKNIYEKQRANDNKRAFVLTRSAFTGQQQFGSVIWSGDIGVDFKTLKEQIPTGLNFCMTGIPYWNTDIGGYAGGDPKDPDYQEVFTRWFQYGTFTPFFRAHGRREPMETRSGENELWSYGDKNQKILTQYVNLRSRLLPYIYTLSYQVYSEGYTLMRALAFDFLEDKKVFEINDQFMFGNSIMVCPVLEKGATKRDVYLPNGTSWYDFWTGKTFKGGQTISADAPAETIPLFVKSGSIIPMGEIMQYSDEKSAEELEIRVYAGKDASFTLYEDEGDNYNYEKGMNTQIPIQYSSKNKELTIGSRLGSFNGMLDRRIFNVVLVSEGVGTAVNPTNRITKTVNYNGKLIKIDLST